MQRQLAGVAVVAVLGTGAVLVFWEKDDDALEKRRVGLVDELLTLREADAEVRDAQNAEADRLAAERATSKPVRVAVARPVRPTTKRCPYCQDEIPIRALKCRSCGEYLDEDLSADRRPHEWSPGVAAVLSFLIPGLGQMYRGKVLSGFIWLLLVEFPYAVAVVSFFAGFLCCVSWVGVACLPFGFVLHVLCLFDAASGRSRR